MNRKTGIITLAFMTGWSMFLAAVEVKRITKKTFSDFEKGGFHQVTIDSQGALRLGPKSSPVSGPVEEFYFSLDITPTGDLYVGTGHNASIFKLPPNGKPELIFKGEQLDVYALQVLNNGDIIAGTSPNGKVYRISGKDKKASELLDPEERFIWDFKEDAQGNIICAVGNTGAIYSIRPDGQTEKLFSGDDAHIVSLAITRDGSILAGSGDQGTLYQIKNRKVKVLFDSTLEEIHSICEDQEGNIFFAAIKNVAYSRPVKYMESGTVFRKEDMEEKKEIKEKSILYMLRKDGTHEILWTSEEEYIYSLQYDQTGDSVIMGTGNSGRFYRIRSNGDYSLFLESNSAQIYKMVKTPTGFWAAANNSPSLQFIENRLSSSGTFYSEVIDTKMASRFGRMTWTADLPSGTSVSTSVRCGNSSNPSQAWTDWSAPFNDPENTNINLEGFRFVQFRVVLNSQNASVSPVFYDCTLYYMESNGQPQVKDIRIEKAPLTKKEEGKETTSTGPKKLSVLWTASDPNQDQLLFRLFLKKVGDKKWQLIKENLREAMFLLDMEMFSDGKYQLKVEADDSLANSPATVKKGNVVSSIFLIDSTAPVLSDWVQNGNDISFSVADTISPVNLVVYSYTGNEWFPLFPADMITDSRVEKFAVTLSDLSQHSMIYIKVADEFNNYKVFQREL